MGLEEGVNTWMFGICGMFGIIRMLDGRGVGREGGEEGSVVKKVVRDFKGFVCEGKNFGSAEEKEKEKKLKEV
ncbi:divergent PAP2 family protein, partial [Bacillus pumilus]|uniref:divergent PAP2 family protein n=1 Tax=Bacillus pumilus TaxID=1408 RepID=UPI0034D972F2